MVELVFFVYTFDCVYTLFSGKAGPIDYISKVDNLSILPAFGRNRA
jgi:hypothetical protein